MRLAFLTPVLAVILMFAGAASAMDKENTLYIDLKDGRVVIEMRPDLAPQHVAQIKKLAREGKYDGVVFHRVIDNFMVQGGGYDAGYTEKKTRAPVPHEGREALAKGGDKNVAGTLAMARTNDPNSARSQFFIVFKDSNFLDGQYTVWGKVTSGMEFVDKIKKGAPGSGAVSAPADKMIKVQVAADAKS